MRQFFILTALINISIAAQCQQKKGMEYVITDSATLVSYKYRIPELIRSGSHAELAYTFKLLADYYYVIWKKDSLLLYYQKALKAYETVKDSFNIYYCYHRIGETAWGGKNYDASLSWHLPAAAYFERVKEYHMAAFSNYAISSTYQAKGDVKRSEEYLNKAIVYNRQAKDTLLDIIIMSSFFEKLKKEKKWNEIYNAAEKMVQLSRIIKQPVFIKVGLLQMGNSLLEQGFPEKALPVLEESNRIEAQTNGADEETLRLIIICHLRLNQNQEAERYVSLYKKISDSLSNKRETDNYKELLVQYETEKKEATITALERENNLKQKLADNQRHLIGLLVAGLGIVLISGFVLYRNFKRRQRLEKQIQKQKEQFSGQLLLEKEQKMLAEFDKQLAEVQLTALSAQMNPHFIFNCMNSIQKYVLKNEKTKALEFLQNFSELMRSVLDNSVRTKVALDEEINMLEKYILLEQQRLENKFDYRIDISPDLQTDFFEIPGMIIQPYVENAIWHGLMNLPDVKAENEAKGLLCLIFKKEGSMIKCVIEDNGVGRKKAAELEKYKSPKRKSYGMAIARKRLELLQKENIEVPEIFIEDRLDQKKYSAGTRVTIFIHVD